MLYRLRKGPVLELAWRREQRKHGKRTGDLGFGEHQVVGKHRRASRRGVRLAVTTSRRSDRWGEHATEVLTTVAVTPVVREVRVEL